MLFAGFLKGPVMVRTVFCALLLALVTASSVLAQSPQVRFKRTQLDESLRAAALSLSDKDLAEIERLVPRGAAAGERYPTYGMASLDGGK